MSDPHAKKKGLALHVRIGIGMAAGAALGLGLHALSESGTIDAALVASVARWASEIGRLFLRLLQMVVVPLVLASLITGVMGLGDPKTLGRLGGRTLLLYLVTSLVAILTGLALVNVIRPGVGVARDAIASGEHAVPTTVSEGPTDVGSVLLRQLTNMIPQNPARAIADGDMLPIIFFAVLFGLFASLVGGVHGRRIEELSASVFAVMMRLTMAIIELAPFAVFAFVLSAAAGTGLAAFQALGWYALTVALGLAIHAGVTLPVLVRVLARRSPLELARAMRPALLTAFGTASSSATLPLTMECMTERAKVPNRVASFVLPLGATVNMDGTALYEAVAVLFIAQAYGAGLTFAQQVVVALTALLASIGAAGIPHAGTVMMVVVLTAVGLPTDAVGLILAVDRVLDMGRTTVNVWSDCCVAAIVAADANASLPGDGASSGARVASLGDDESEPDAP